MSKSDNNCFKKFFKLLKLNEMNQLKIEDKLTL